MSQDPTNPTFKVLMIEDDRDQLEPYRTRFKMDPEVKLIEAESGRQGLELSVSEQPDLILLDLLLGDTSGWQVLKQLKTQDRTAKIPVVVLTNLYNSQVAQNCRKLEALDCWLKTETAPGQALQRIKEISNQL